MPWDDETLILGLKRRDNGAVQYAVETYAPKLYRYAVYQLGNPTAAEDLVSEVVTRMLERIDDYRYTGVPLQAWLFSIARNLVTDGFRRRNRAPMISLDNPQEAGTLDDLGSVDARLDALADRDLLVRLLGRLTEEQRQILTLRIVEGWQPADIARLLGRSIDSVKSLQYRGIQSLRRFWQEDMGAEDARQVELEQG